MKVNMENQKYGTDMGYKFKPLVTLYIFFITLHIGGLFGFYLLFYSHLTTVLWTIIWDRLTVIGITVGAHRMYSHKSFKPNSKVLRMILVGLHTLSGQFTLYRWVQAHRLHHKHTDTDADPHNSKRGFLFAHLNWMLHKKHPLVVSQMKKIDMTDLQADKIVMFQKEHYLPLYILLNMLTVVIPVYFWNENFLNAFFVSYILRYLFIIHAACSINSFAHMFGTRPYDKSISPVQSALLSFISGGEGWHNYHHTFPWDYKVAELGSRFNLGAKIIEALNALGLIYDLRTASDDLIKSVVLKRGDGSHPKYKEGSVRVRVNMENQKYGTDIGYKFTPLVSMYIIVIVLHIGGLYGFYLMFYSHLTTVLWTIIWNRLCLIGIIVGAHRMYSHRSFKPNSKVLRMILVGLHTLTGQFTLYRWVQVHRLHHKHTDTDADPHNSNRGFLFAHLSWMLYKKHPLVVSQMKTIDMTDLQADKIVMFQKEHILPLYILLNTLTVVVPIYFWNESFLNSFFVCYFSRFLYVLHVAACINSFAHMFGTRPYDRSIRPAESPLLSYITGGEGWHNYHHTFPWDYKVAELGSGFNLGAKIIEALNALGFVHDLRTTSDDLIKSVVSKRGDGSHSKYTEAHL